VLATAQVPGDAARITAMDVLYQIALNHPGLCDAAVDRLIEDRLAEADAAKHAVTRNRAEARAAVDEAVATVRETIKREFGRPLEEVAATDAPLARSVFDDMARRTTDWERTAAIRLAAANLSVPIVRMITLIKASDASAIQKAVSKAPGVEPMTFSDAAWQFSTHPSFLNRGLLPPVYPGSLNGSLEKVIERMAVGEVSPVLRVPNLVDGRLAYVILTVEERRAASPLKDPTSDLIEAAVRARPVDFPEYNNWLRSAYSRFGVRVNYQFGTRKFAAGDPPVVPDAGLIDWEAEVPETLVKIRRGGVDLARITRDEYVPYFSYKHVDEANQAVTDLVIREVVELERKRLKIDVPTHQIVEELRKQYKEMEATVRKTPGLTLEQLLAHRGFTPERFHQHLVELQQLTVPMRKMIRYHQITHARFQCSGIMMRDRGKMDLVLRDLKSGALKFDDAVKKFSESPDADRGGLLHAFYEGGGLPEFETVASKMNDGDVSPVFEVRDLEGAALRTEYWILRMDQRTDGRKLSFAEAEPEIVRDLEARPMANWEFNTWIAQMYRDYQIVDRRYFR
jgi:parvulin-like peptidyl-prolyl isomerase